MPNVIFDTFIRENLEKMNKEEFSNFSDFWKVKIAPLLRSVKWPSDQVSASVYLPEEFEKAYWIGFAGGERHPDFVIAALYNGWRKEIEAMGRIMTHEQSSRFRRYAETVNPDTVESERRLMMDGVMKKVLERVSAERADIERKAELRRNTRLVRLTTGEIQRILDMIDNSDLADSLHELRGKLNDSLTRGSKK